MNLAARIAHRLASLGCAHPMAAAAAVAVRGLSGLDQVSFADQLGISIEELQAIEGGFVGVADLPAGLTQRLPACGLDPVELINREATIRCGYLAP